MKHRVLAIASALPPNYLYGGPAVSLENLSRVLRDTVNFTFMTKTRDFGSGHENSLFGTWVDEPIGPSITCRNTRQWLLTLVTLIRDQNNPYQTIYINSLFSLDFSILPVLVSLLIGTLTKGTAPKILIAPRGELNSGALSIKSFKKRACIWVLRLIYAAQSQRIQFHGTSKIEEEEIQRYFPRNKVRVATNPPRVYLLEEPVRQSPRIQGLESFRLGYISRITPKKNLLGLLEALMDCTMLLSLEVYGPVDDAAYAARAHSRTMNLPDNIEVRWHGFIDPANLSDTIGSVDCVAVPTHGENFGHALWESLALGRPLITGTNVPWINLEVAGAGVNVDPDDQRALTVAVEEFAQLPTEELHGRQVSAREYARENPDPTLYLEANRLLFL